MKMQKVRLKFDVVIVVPHVPSRSGNTLILAIMLSLRQVLPLRIRLALRFPTQKSQCSKNPVSDKLQQLMVVSLASPMHRQAMAIIMAKASPSHQPTPVQSTKKAALHTIRAMRSLPMNQRHPTRQSQPPSSRVARAHHRSSAHMHHTLSLMSRFHLLDVLLLRVRSHLTDSASKIGALKWPLLYVYAISWNLHVYYYNSVLGLELEVVLGMGWMLAVLHFIYLLGRTVYYSYPSYVVPWFDHFAKILGFR
jgi:hypothetical protein